MNPPVDTATILCDRPRTDTALVIALVALLGSVISAVVTAFGAPALQGRRDADAVLRSYRQPLMSAAFELQSRLYNLLRGNFAARYLHGAPPDRRAAALHSTLFVIAQYFAWVEITRREVQLLRFPRAADTRETARLMQAISETFLTDAYGQQLMVWRLEQRGIGEMMLDEQAGRPVCVGYASFVASEVPQTMKALAEDICAMDEGGRNRATAVQHLALDLLKQLDPDGVVYSKDLRKA